MNDARELPRALIPWAEYLNLLPSEQIVAFAPLVQRLDSAIGPLRVQTRSGDGEPDGFDGISRRGAYDRLLLSEWLLADEMPDEFARRAVMSEHAFLQIARQEPAGARVSFALFDAGPNQLGAPRIAHLAALIVLARRAEAAGATLMWGILQRPEEPFKAGVSASGLAYLFASRCASEATEAHLNAWREKAPLKPGSEEFWMVGGDRIRRLTDSADTSFLIVGDSLNSGDRYLEAEIRPAGKSASQVRLDLPDDSDCVRLMREPKHESSPRHARLPTLGSPPTSNLLFLPGGVKLAGRLSRNQLVCYPVPNSPFAGVGKSRSISARSRESILAVGRFGRSYAIVTTTPEPRVFELLLPDEKFGSVARFRIPESVTLPEIRDDSPVSPLFHISGGSEDSCWITVLGNACIQFGRITAADDPEEPYSPSSELVEVTDAEVLDAPLAANVLWPGGEVATLGYARGKWRLEARSSSETCLYRTFSHVSQAFFGAAGHYDRTKLAAVQQSRGSWRLCNLHSSNNEANDLTVTPTGGEVMGVYGLRPIAENQKIGLILLDDDLRTIRFWFPNASGAMDASGVVLQTDSDIIQIAVSPYLANGIVVTNIAYLTQGGLLAVYSLNYSCNLLELQFTDGLNKARAELASTVAAVDAVRGSA